VAAPGVIDTQSMANQAAEYNLDLLNKLTYRLSLSVVGRTGIFARDVCTVDIPEVGISSEQFFIYAMEHNWSRSGYVTNLDLRK
jgi:hypothetical protein